MTAITMKTVTGVLKKLMGLWEDALDVTIKTGYWQDTYACHRLIQEYGKKIAETIREGGFSGDSNAAFDGWVSLVEMEEKSRNDQMEYVRARLLPVNPDVWWMILECAPNATDSVVRAAYVAKMGECHPDKVAHLAPLIREVANTMAQKLNKAWSEYRDQRA